MLWKHVLFFSELRYPPDHIGVLSAITPLATTVESRRDVKEAKVYKNFRTKVLNLRNEVFFIGGLKIENSCDKKKLGKLNE